MSTAHVLVVDDDPTNLELMSTVLTLNGFLVDTAGDAQDCVDAVARRVPDLILMDLQLPGIDGYELTRRLKAAATTAAVPVIAVTANAMSGDESRALAAGCSGYIAKPIDVRLFPDQVASFLPDRASNRPVVRPG